METAKPQKTHHLYKWLITPACVALVVLYYTAALLNPSSMTLHELTVKELTLGATLLVAVVLASIARIARQARAALLIMVTLLLYAAVVWTSFWVF
jgi:hypothetical protein